MVQEAEYQMCYQGDGSNPSKSEPGKIQPKKGLWAENDTEIRAALNDLKKVKETEMPNTKRERNYLKDMTLADARLWFRYRCQIIDNIKGNRSSQWRNDMACRHCTSGGNETQDHAATSTQKVKGWT